MDLLLWTIIDSSLLFLIFWHDQLLTEREENILISLINILTKRKDKEVLLLEKILDVEKEMYMTVTMRTSISLHVNDKK